MAKEFKSVDELVRLLESRGVSTDANTPSILKRESYYAVINGYKDPFLDHEAMRSAPDDVYKQGTTFDQIYDFFLLDREVRWALFPYLTTCETMLKNAVVHAFCERYPDPEAYLDRANYVNSRDMLVPDGFKGNKARLHAKNLSDLMARLNGKVTMSGGYSKPFIRRYMEKYGFVPLWVLQNDLTFGNVEHFYQLQKRGVQNAACRTVSELTDNESRRIGARDMLRAFAVLVHFRNICAHDDRLHCANTKGMGLRALAEALRMVLPEEEFGRLRAGIVSLIPLHEESAFLGRFDRLL